MDKHQEELRKELEKVSDLERRLFGSIFEGLDTENLIRNRHAVVRGLEEFEMTTDVRRQALALASKGMELLSEAQGSEEYGETGTAEEYRRQFFQCLRELADTISGRQPATSASASSSAAAPAAFARTSTDPTEPEPSSGAWVGVEGGGGEVECLLPVPRADSSNPNQSQDGPSALFQPQQPQAPRGPNSSSNNPNSSLSSWDFRQIGEDPVRGGDRDRGQDSPRRGDPSVHPQQGRQGYGSVDGSVGSAGDVPHLSPCMGGSGTGGVETPRRDSTAQGSELRLGQNLPGREENGGRRDSFGGENGGGAGRGSRRSPDNPDPRRRAPPEGPLSEDSSSPRTPFRNLFRARVERDNRDEGGRGAGGVGLERDRGRESESSDSSDGPPPKITIYPTRIRTKPVRSPQVDTTRSETWGGRDRFGRRREEFHETGSVGSREGGGERERRRGDLRGGERHHGEERGSSRLHPSRGGGAHSERGGGRGGSLRGALPALKEASSDEDTVLWRQSADQGSASPQSSRMRVDGIPPRLGGDGYRYGDSPVDPPNGMQLEPDEGGRRQWTLGEEERERWERTSNRSQVVSSEKRAKYNRWLEQVMVRKREKKRQREREQEEKRLEKERKEEKQKEKEERKRVKSEEQERLRLSQEQEVFNAQRDRRDRRASSDSGDSCSAQRGRRDRRPFSESRDAYEGERDRRDRRPFSESPDAYEEGQRDRRDRRPFSESPDAYEEGQRDRRDRRPFSESPDAYEEGQRDRRDRRPFSESPDAYEGQRDRRDRRPFSESPDAYEEGQRDRRDRRPFSESPDAYEEGQRDRRDRRPFSESPDAYEEGQRDRRDRRSFSESPDAYEGQGVRRPRRHRELGPRNEVPPESPNERRHRSDLRDPFSREWGSGERRREKERQVTRTARVKSEASEGPPRHSQSPHERSLLQIAAESEGLLAWSELQRRRMAIARQYGKEDRKKKRHKKRSREGGRERSPERDEDQSKERDGRKEKKKEKKKKNDREGTLSDDSVKTQRGGKRVASDRLARLIKKQRKALRRAHLEEVRQREEWLQRERQERQRRMRERRRTRSTPPPPRRSGTGGPSERERDQVKVSLILVHQEELARLASRFPPDALSKFQSNHLQDSTRTKPCPLLEPLGVLCPVRHRGPLEWDLLWLQSGVREGKWFTSLSAYQQLAQKMYEGGLQNERVLFGACEWSERTKNWGGNFSGPCVRSTGALIVGEDPSRFSPAFGPETSMESLKGFKAAKLVECLAEVMADVIRLTPRNRILRVVAEPTHEGVQRSPSEDDGSDAGSEKRSGLHLEDAELEEEEEEETLLPPLPRARVPAPAPSGKSPPSSAERTVRHLCPPAEAEAEAATPPSEVASEFGDGIGTACVPPEAEAAERAAVAEVAEALMAGGEEAEGGAAAAAKEAESEPESSSDEDAAEVESGGELVFELQPESVITQTIKEAREFGLTKKKNRRASLDHDDNSSNEDRVEGTPFLPSPSSTSFEEGWDHPLVVWTRRHRMWNLSRSSRALKRQEDMIQRLASRLYTERQMSGVMAEVVGVTPVRLWLELFPKTPIDGQTKFDLNANGKTFCQVLDDLLTQMKDVVEKILGVQEQEEEDRAIPQPHSPPSSNQQGIQTPKSAHTSSAPPAEEEEILSPIMRGPSAAPVRSPDSSTPGPDPSAPGSPHPPQSPHSSMPGSSGPLQSPHSSMPGSSHPLQSPHSASASQGSVLSASLPNPSPAAAPSVIRSVSGSRRAAPTEIHPNCIDLRFAQSAGQVKEAARLLRVAVPRGTTPLGFLGPQALMEFNGAAFSDSEGDSEDSDDANSGPVLQWRGKWYSGWKLDDSLEHRRELVRLLTALRQVGPYGVVVVVGLFSTVQDGNVSVVVNPQLCVARDAEYVEDDQVESSDEEEEEKEESGGEESQNRSPKILSRQKSQDSDNSSNPSSAKENSQNSSTDSRRKQGTASKTSHRCPFVFERLPLEMQGHGSLPTSVAIAECLRRVLRKARERDHIIRNGCAVSTSDPYSTPVLPMRSPCAAPSNLLMSPPLPFGSPPFPLRSPASNHSVPYSRHSAASARSSEDPSESTAGGHAPDGPRLPRVAPSHIKCRGPDGQLVSGPGLVNSTDELIQLVGEDSELMASLPEEADVAGAIVRFRGGFREWYTHPKWESLIVRENKDGSILGRGGGRFGGRNETPKIEVQKLMGRLTPLCKKTDQELVLAFDQTKREAIAWLEGDEVGVSRVMWRNETRTMVVRRLLQRVYEDMQKKVKLHFGGLGLRVDTGGGHGGEDRESETGVDDFGDGGEESDGGILF
uniref:Uncharacterized protein n=1 Tax=Chromera velia CCMP2878 TaxID=1169474 RepID=A0A0G4HKJ9_9ALVE|eukprot:Cvel_28664.t1-p1 / transcript=Cvel_28664.t1 / gene=Cvel_28664 / organism=Chromera_velia_CCMP2878 / gene_product=Nuclear speckle splicing regulatory protein 1, putative / transcript_product=Nuclear speckle splicing regulatory protein 1, putative / location=Cvel_scaffold3795:19-9739(-) / protein_length=2300 / sequence_SO=supercontig / SO=protein_coding / is_pseudo=false